MWTEVFQDTAYAIALLSGKDQFRVRAITLAEQMPDHGLTDALTTDEHIPSTIRSTAWQRAESTRGFTQALPETDARREMPTALRP